MHPENPAKVLHALDRAMRSTTPDVVATSVLAVVTPATEGLVVEWSNAGHPPPVLVSSDGASRLLDTPPDLLLGLDAATDRTSHRMLLERGATLVLYSDGLIERRNAPISRGLEWLVGVLKGQHRQSVEGICDYLLETAFAVEDDVVLLVLRA
jgi:serine phosphatase RsbU (regulator of sigma subunit)